MQAVVTHGNSGAFDSNSFGLRVMSSKLRATPPPSHHLHTTLHFSRRSAMGEVMLPLAVTTTSCSACSRGLMMVRSLAE